MSAKKSVTRTEDIEQLASACGIVSTQIDTILEEAVRSLDGGILNDEVISGSATQDTKDAAAEVKATLNKLKTDMTTVMGFCAKAANTTVEAMQMNAKQQAQASENVTAAASKIKNKK